MTQPISTIMVDEYQLIKNKTTLNIGKVQVGYLNHFPFWTSARR